MIWDGDVRGFGVRVFPTGKRSYLVQYRAGRRTRRLTLGQHGPLTTDEARSLAKQRLGDVARGDDPSETRKQKRMAPTVAALCDRFMAEYVAEHCKPTTFANYKTAITTHVKPKLGMLQIADVTRADVAELHHNMKATPYHANRVVMVMSKMFNVAEDWGLRAEGTNPTRRIKKYKEVEKKRYLSDDEQSRLGEVLFAGLERGDYSEYVVAAFMLLLLTGCRLREIQTLKWDYITRTHLELPDSKTGRRRIPLPREAWDVLDALPRRDGNPYVILGDKADGHYNDLQKPWRKIRARAGLDDVRIHDLRHTYASVAVTNGIDPFMLKEIMGHKNLTTTLRYAHLADDAVQRAAGSVAARLAGAIRKDRRAEPTLRVVR
ncbi:phage integrase family protein [Celeribacter baekdonensis B30]|uniref:Phage integrase family protein n=1 Tax=Celeribacter baekdonensis B30 TaxID=1208323 RepID=K2JSA7_9RHOB|nr:phage integrase family protein [Celeribacter baekdonensis B30]